MTDEFIPDFEKDTVDSDTFSGMDANLSPELYIHRSLLSLNEALKNPDVRQGMMQYIAIVDHMEAITTAWGKITQEGMTEQIKKYKEGKNIAEGDEIKDMFKIAQGKVRIIMTELFSSKLDTSSLIVR
jgi:hypothetical protein